MEMKDREQAKKENERKKEYLNRYLESVRAIRRAEEELQEIRIMKMGISASGDGMPHGGGQSDLSNYAATLDDIERDLRAAKRRRVRTYIEIRNTIESIKNSKERDVIFYRYIKGMDWWEIAEKMKYTERWVKKLHGKALAHMERQKEFPKVP